MAGAALQAITLAVPVLIEARLTPGELPARFEATVGSSDAGLKAQVYIDRRRVIVKRRLDGHAAMTLNLALRVYRGVALRVFPTAGGKGYLAMVALVHDDPDLTVPLYAGTCADEVAEAWTMWGAALRLPLLAIDRCGSLREIARQPAPVRASPKPRRRHSHFAARRPRFLSRRKVGGGIRMVWRGEREIIAPD